MATLQRTYDSVNELLEACDTAHKSGRVHGGSERAFTRSGFIGRSFQGWEDCKLKSGETWLEGVVILEQILAQLQGIQLPQPVCRKRKVRHSEDGGDEIDVDRLRAGDPAFWQQGHREIVTAPQTVAIFCNTATPCQKNARDVFWRGAAGIMLADLLSQAGFSVELYAINFTNRAFNTGNNLFQSTLLKKASQPLDTATVVNALSGWFFRTICFQAFYTITGERPQSNLGYAATLTEQTPELVQLASNATTIVIDRIWDLRAAEYTVRAALESLRATAESN